MLSRWVEQRDVGELVCLFENPPVGPGQELSTGPSLSTGGPALYGRVRVGEFVSSGGPWGSPTT